MKLVVRFLPLALISIFLLIHLLIINDYGFTWDFHHHFFAGARLLGKTWEQVDPRPLPYTEPDPRTTAKIPYGPLVQLIPTASLFLFHDTLPLLPEDAAYHLPIILAGIFGLLFLYLFMRDAFGPASGIVAIIFLGLTPRFFSDMHNNMKDIPSASMIALNILLIWRFSKKPTLANIILASIGFALAFNTKINAIFIPIIFGLWLLLRNAPFLIKRVAQYMRAGSIKNFIRLHFLFRMKPMEIKSLELKTRLNLPCRQAGFRLRPKHSENYFSSVSLPIGRRGPIYYFFIFAFYLLLSILLSSLLWFLIWGEPITNFAKDFILSFVMGVDNLEVLLNGAWYCAGKNVPWFYSLWYLGVTTPLPVLIFFLFGIIICLKRWLRNNESAPLLLLLWFTVPLTRYALPRIGVIDGIRHFEEVLFPMSAIAAAGGVAIAQRFHRTRIWTKRIRTWMVVIVSGITIAFLMTINILYHPFQITYFNELVGGVWGANGKYDLDYWGGSQKYAVQWINQHAPGSAIVTIAMAADVASRYLRPDLVPLANTRGYDGADYVVILNRQSFFYRYEVAPYLLTHTPVFTVENQGVPMVWIFDNAKPAVRMKLPWWQGYDPCIRR